MNEKPVYILYNRVIERGQSFGQVSFFASIIEECMCRKEERTACLALLSRKGVRATTNNTAASSATHEGCFANCREDQTKTGTIEEGPAANDDRKQMNRNGAPKAVICLTFPPLRTTSLTIREWTVELRLKSFQSNALACFAGRSALCSTAPPGHPTATASGHSEQRQQQRDYAQTPRKSSEWKTRQTLLSRGNF